MLANTDWLSPWMYTGPLHGIPIIRSLYRRPRRYSQHCFMATNSLPNVELSTLVCFRECQYIGEPCRKIRNPVLDRLVTVSEAWSASTFALVTKPSPRGSGAFLGSSSIPSMCPNLLEVQSLRSYFASSITGLLGSKTNSAL